MPAFQDVFVRGLSFEDVRIDQDEEVEIGLSSVHSDNGFDADLETEALVFAQIHLGNVSVSSSSSGVLYVRHGAGWDIEVTDVTFSGATVYNGAIWVDCFTDECESNPLSLSVRDCTFTGLSGDGAGTAIHIDRNTTAHVYDTVITGNDVGTNPNFVCGALYLSSDSTLGLNSCVITDNSCAGDGSGVGAIYGEFQAIGTDFGSIASGNDNDTYDITWSPGGGLYHFYRADDECQFSCSENYDGCTDYSGDCLTLYDSVQW